jgi:hypothetical protein
MPFQPGHTADKARVTVEKVQIELDQRPAAIERKYFHNVRRFISVAIDIAVLEPMGVAARQLRDARAPRNRGCRAADQERCCSHPEEKVGSRHTAAIAHVENVCNGWKPDILRTILMQLLRESWQASAASASDANLDSRSVPTLTHR